MVVRGFLGQRLRRGTMRDYIHGAVMPSAGYAMPSAGYAVLSAGYAVLSAGYALFAVLICLPAVAGERPSPEQLQAWVKQLDAEDYAAREEATRQLTAAAEDSIEALAAGVSSQSPEVAWRASESLQEIAIQGSEATLTRVVAALDQLSKNGKPGLSNVAPGVAGQADQAAARPGRGADSRRSAGSSPTAAKWPSALTAVWDSLEASSAGSTSCPLLLSQMIFAPWRFLQSSKRKRRPTSPARSRPSMRL